MSSSIIVAGRWDAEIRSVGQRVQSFHTAGRMNSGIVTHLMVTTENTAMCSYRVDSKFSLHTQVHESMYMINSLTLVILTMSIHIKTFTHTLRVYVLIVQIKLEET